ncbi:hypothetical protein ACHWUR_19315 [Klebsiella pneumoniae]
MLTGEAYIHAIPATLIALCRRAGHAADRAALPAEDGDCHRAHRHRAGPQRKRPAVAARHSDAAGHRRLSGPADAPSARPPPAARFYPSAAAGGAASGGAVPPVSPVPARAGRSLAAAGPPQRASAAAAAAQPAGQSLPAAGAQQYVSFLLPDEEGKRSAEKWLQQWLQTPADGEEGLSLLCGLSAPVRQLQGYPRALSQARQALDLSRYPAANPAHQRLSAAGVYQTAVRGQRPGAAQRFYARHPRLP